MRAKALLLLCVLAVSSYAQDTSATVTEISCEVQGQICQAGKSLDLCLEYFDDAGLKRSVLEAVNRGVVVRLLLDPEFKENRMAAAGLRQLGLQLRWQDPGACTYLIVDKRVLVSGDFDGSTLGSDLTGGEIDASEDVDAVTAMNCDFEESWEQGTESVPVRLNLKDQLEALPDPRENDPRVQTQRRKM